MKSAAISNAQTNDRITIGPSPSGRGSRLEAVQWLPQPLERVFEFFSDAFQLETITPPWLHFAVLNPRPLQIVTGTLIDYRLRLHGVPFRWQTRIDLWEPPVRFVDKQLSGPYRRWHHEHRFEAVAGGTRCHDVVDYEVPGGALIDRISSGATSAESSPSAKRNSANYSAIRRVPASIEKGTARQADCFRLSARDTLEAALHLGYSRGSIVDVRHGSRPVCGIVGLLVKRRTLCGSLGEWITPMLACMGDRGPDSAGLAVFSGPRVSPAPQPKANTGDVRRYSLYAGREPIDWQSLLEQLRRDAGTKATLTPRDNHAVLETAWGPTQVRDWLGRTFPRLLILSIGSSIDLYKDVGHPRAIAERYAFPKLAGSHAVGHTRMATESAVTPAHAHPFTAGEDFCLVHNGSLSNPYSIRRMLEKRGIRFETDNDTEAACRFLEWRLSAGDSLEAAIERALGELDGFFTLLMATADKLVLVRDAFACKPAVIAETDDYVAVGSEFRSLAHLPGIGDARIFEPAPERIYSWKAASVA